MSFSSFLASGYEADGNKNPIGLFSINQSTQSVTVSATAPGSITTLRVPVPTNLIPGVQYIQDWIIILKNNSGTAITGNLSITEQLPIPGVSGNIYQYIGIEIAQNQQISLNFKNIQTYVSGNGVFLGINFIDATSGISYSVVSASCFLVANPSPI